MRILTAMLTETHKRAGLYLEEDDHILLLKQGQRTLARFSATGATIAEVRKEADKYAAS
jgi:hypothetical protein